MDCAKSLELLSDYQSDSLGEADKLLVHTHLLKCKDCDGVFQDILMIVQAANVLRNADGTINYPDETAFWKRLSINGKIH